MHECDGSLKRAFSDSSATMHLGAYTTDATCTSLHLRYCHDHATETLLPSFIPKLGHAEAARMLRGAAQAKRRAREIGTRSTYGMMRGVVHFFTCGRCAHGGVYVCLTSVSLRRMMYMLPSVRRHDGVSNHRCGRARDAGLRSCLQRKRTYKNYQLMNVL